MLTVDVDVVVVVVDGNYSLLVNLLTHFIEYMVKLKSLFLRSSILSQLINASKKLKWYNTWLIDSVKYTSNIVFDRMYGSITCDYIHHKKRESERNTHTHIL